MKVMQLAQKPQRRGAEIFASELNEQLEAMGCNTQTTYLYKYYGESPLPLQESDAVLSGDDSSLEYFPGFHPYLLRELIRLINRFSPDIVQLNGARSVKYGALARWIRGRQLGAKLVYRIIDIPSFWNRRWWKVAIYRRTLLPQIDGMIGVSELSLEDAIDLYKFRGPAKVILNGINPRKLLVPGEHSLRRHTAGFSDEHVILLFLNSLVTQKRPDRFIRVFAHVRDSCPHARAWIVGDGPLRSTTEQLAQDLGVFDDCRFFGYQSEVGAFINEADIVVLTSDTEGTPAVALEAGYLARPVVATRVGGLAESVVNGETGILVDRSADGRTEEELGRAILQLASNSDARHALGQNARLRVQSFFTIDRIASQYLDFYEQLLGRAS